MTSLKDLMRIFLIAVFILGCFWILCLSYFKLPTIRSSSENFDSKKKQIQATDSKKGVNQNICPKKENNLAIGPKKKQNLTIGSKVDEDQTIGSKKEQNQTIAFKKEQNQTIGYKREQDLTSGSEKEQEQTIGCKQEKDQITILIWMWPFGEAFTLSSCSALFNIVDCHLTSDQNMFNESDGVIIHHRDIYWNLSNMPPSQRPQFQKWVWMNFESPTNSRKITGLKSVFNLTANYRQDADIPVPYGTIIQIEGNNFKIPSKNKLVCWIVSNWEPHYRRSAYYDMLKQFIYIHVYGNSFEKPVSSQDFIPTIASCKFYLSFENAIHKDYITEKLYNPLSAGTVPIVLGPSRHNYENFVPGDAFIHVDDFPSPKELAEHILFLHKNEDMYQQYFNWRRHFRAMGTSLFMRAICFTCKYIRTHKEYKAINDLDAWYWG